MLSTALILSGCTIKRSDDKSNATPTNTSSPSLQPSPTPAEESEKTNLEKKTLIAYFGRWGNTPFPDGVDATASASIVLGENDQFLGTTEFIARLIEEHTGGELHLIQTTEAYPADYDATIDQNHKEQKENFLPQIKNTVENMDQYDTIFIGYPIWSSTIPQAIKSFLSEYDFSGKTIIPFCTHAGYGNGKSYEDIATFASDAFVSQGIAIEAGQLDTAEQEITKWLDAMP